MEIQKNRYIIITPVKNELPYFRVTLDSVCSQSILPVRWIIIDDESIDGTSDLIEKYVANYYFIEHHRLVTYKPELDTTGGRSGTLMNYARKLINENIDFIVKIDADISFGNFFFNNLFIKLLENPKLGIVSGHLIQDGVPEKIRNYNSARGATRIYKKECFDKIGFFYESRGEDEMDNYKAQFLGWEIKTFNEYFHHLKPEGNRNNYMKNNFETGEYKGRIPYNFLFFIGTLIKNIKKRPYIVASGIQLFGYVSSRFFKRERPFEKEVCNFVRLKQKRRILSFITFQKI